jgi:hypothetical protein
LEAPPLVDDREEGGVRWRVIDDVEEGGKRSYMMPRSSSEGSS